MRLAPCCQEKPAEEILTDHQLDDQQPGDNTPTKCMQSGSFYSINLPRADCQIDQPGPKGCQHCDEQEPDDAGKRLQPRDLFGNGRERVPPPAREAHPWQKISRDSEER